MSPVDLPSGSDRLEAEAFSLISKPKPLESYEVEAKGETRYELNIYKAKAKAEVT